MKFNFDYENYTKIKLLRIYVIHCFFFVKPVYQEKLIFEKKNLKSLEFVGLLIFKGEMHVQSIPARRDIRTHGKMTLFSDWNIFHEIKRLRIHQHSKR